MPTLASYLPCTPLHPPYTPLHPLARPRTPRTPSHPSQVVHVLATTAWGAVAIDEHLTRQIGVRATRDQRDPRVKFADGSWLGGHRADYQA